MADTVTERARAKLNLALHVRHRRDDGYHELETLFAFVEDGDEVTVSVGTAGFTLSGPFAGELSGEGDNLVLRAERRFRDTFGIAEAHAIALDKRLPVASGLGGGSADAAATLRALARLHRVAPDDPALFDCAAALGSDVPACLYSRTAIGRGRGDLLEPVAGLAGQAVLLVNPRVAVATAPVFAGWDGIDRGPMPQGDLLPVALAGRNDLEPPARALAPEIDTVLDALAASEGALLVRMSGSGATCFALYAEIAARDAAAARLAAAHPDWWQLPTHLA